MPAQNENLKKHEPPRAHDITRHIPSSQTCSRKFSLIDVQHISWLAVLTAFNPALLCPMYEYKFRNTVSDSDRGS